MFPDRSPRRLLSVLACAVALLGACVDSARSAKMPIPGGRGTPVGASSRIVIDASGGSLTSPDGVVTITVPAGAVSTPTDFTIQPITNTAPGAVGNAYRLEPADATFASSVTLTFRLPDGSPPIDTVSIARQDPTSRYWVRLPATTRDPAAGTLSIAATDLGDYALSTGPNDRDLIGIVRIDTTMWRMSVAAEGRSSLSYADSDPSVAYYVQSGTMKVLPNTTSMGNACTTTADTSDIPANVVEVFQSPQKFQWGISAHWPMTCGGTPGTTDAVAAIDTVGINYIGCARGYVGTPVITDTELSGSYAIDCGADGKVTATWQFKQCQEGAACDLGVACHTGQISCASGLPTCVDVGNVSNGATCDVDPAVPEVCNNGTCNACSAGVACTTNPNTCMEGVTSCATGVQECVDSDVPKANGTVCGPDGVCYGGACTACVSNALCDTNPDPCKKGITSCSTGVQQCIDDPANLEANGLVCGVDQVCNGGVCSACVANQPCDTNPNPCQTGVTSCDTGVSVCTDNPAAPEANGLACGTDLVCVDGACVTCVAGAACTTNPNTCLPGVTSCQSGIACLDDATQPAAKNGATCDVDPAVPEVCNNGTCSACTAGTACSTNPNKCVAGATSCSTGVETCVDTTTPINDGVACGGGTQLNVCSAGACVCQAGAACITNPNVCVTGTTVCDASGVQSCVDTTTPANVGGACGPAGTNVCNGIGQCVAPCTPGLSCTGNPNVCVTGVTACDATSGAQSCVDSTTPTNVGGSCGSGLVCDATGQCVAACTAGQACTGNPNVCAAGVTACDANGVESCIDSGTAANPGGACTVGGSAGTCSGTTCVPTPTCTADQPCTTNLNSLCMTGVTSCSTGSEVCVDAAAKQDGTSCGTGLVCSAGQCVAAPTCTPNQPCTTNPSPECSTGLTQCDVSGAESCVDDATTTVTDGASCTLGGVAGAGTCSAGACTVPAAP